MKRTERRNREVTVSDGSLALLCVATAAYQATAVQNAFSHTVMWSQPAVHTTLALEGPLQPAKLESRD